MYEKTSAKKVICRLSLLVSTDYKQDSLVWGIFTNLELGWTGAASVSTCIEISQSSFERTEYTEVFFTNI